MNRGSLCQWGAQSNGFHAWIRLSSCAWSIVGRAPFQPRGQKEGVSQAFSTAICDTALLSRRRPCLTCHPSRLMGLNRVASTSPPAAPPPNFSAFVFFLFPPLSIFSLSLSLSLSLHSISCSLSGPYIAYVTITKSTRIAAAIA